MDKIMENNMDSKMDTMVDIHLSLPEEMLAELDSASQELGVKRAHLLRRAISTLLKDLEKERIAREMIKYSEEMADRSGDFVKETEGHVKRRLLEETEW
jgi:metal-responsive CopG/Arc/MetJ family transcriptional regulator